MTIPLSASLLMLNLTEEYIPIYMIILGFMGFFNAPGYSRTNANELSAFTEGNKKLRFKVIALYSFSRQFLTAFSMILIGWLMEKRNCCCKFRIKLSFLCVNWLLYNIFFPAHLQEILLKR